MALVPVLSAIHLGEFKQTPAKLAFRDRNRIGILVKISVIADRRKGYELEARKAFQDGQRREHSMGVEFQPFAATGCEEIQSAIGASAPMLTSSDF